jgi:hypothetical protein
VVTRRKKYGSERKTHTLALVKYWLNQKQLTETIATMLDTLIPLVPRNRNRVAGNKSLCCCSKEPVAPI